VVDRGTTDKTTDVNWDQSIELTNQVSAETYSGSLGRSRYFDKEIGSNSILITNNFKFMVLNIAG
jgi:hypothetical protein